MFTPRRKLLASCVILVVLVISAPRVLRAQSVTPLTPSVKAAAIPFIGCKSDGQMGPQSAPTGKSQVLAVSASTAQQLAYYKDKFGFGVFGPRGWHCFGAYGSDGDFLYVSPLPINRADLLSMQWSGFTGPVIQMTNEYGGTSGRFGVAAIIARVFPAYKGFVKDVMNEDIEAGINPPNSYASGPYPKDKLTYRGKSIVEYVTAENADGLGTHSRLQKNAIPISGVAILVGPTPDLLLLSMRLPKEQRYLGSVIIQQVERDAASLASSE